MVFTGARCTRLCPRIKCPELENDIYVGHGVSTSVEDKHTTYAIRP